MAAKSLEERVTAGARARLCREFLSDFEADLRGKLWNAAVNGDGELLRSLADRGRMLSEFCSFLSRTENDGCVAAEELERSGVLEGAL